MNKTKSGTAGKTAVLNYNETIVRNVRAHMLDEARLTKLAEFFKVLGDPTRVRIINALAYQELCVSDLFPGRPARARYPGRSADAYQP